MSVPVSVTADSQKRQASKCTSTNPILNSMKPTTPQTDRNAFAITAEKNFRLISTSAKERISSSFKTARSAETRN